MQVKKKRKTQKNYQPHQKETDKETFDSAAP